MKADPSADSSKAFTVNREVSIVDGRRLIFWSWCRLINAHYTSLKLKHSTLRLHFQKLEC